MIELGGMSFDDKDIPTGMLYPLGTAEKDYAVVVLKGWGFLYWGTESVEYKPSDILEITAGLEHRLVAHRNTRVVLVSKKTA